jgi:hypothetical protein
MDVIADTNDPPCYYGLEIGGQFSFGGMSESDIMAGGWENTNVTHNKKFSKENSFFFRRF